MPAAPDAHDVDLLLRLLELILSEPVAKARNFFRTIPDGLTFPEILAKYPRGTDEFRYFDTMMTFWETVGSLLKHGLLNEELAFDTFLDGAPWPKVEAAAVALRKDRGPLELENFEYAYRRAQEWIAAKESASTSTGP